METKNLQTQKGFTLVEIAIVLVIIGLLLGGVLKGQELITNAKIKAVTSDFDNLSAAYYAYQDRIGTIPANNAGGIDSDDQFWTDLRAQGFITGTGSDGATHDLDGVWQAVTGGGTGDAWASGASITSAAFSTNYLCADNIPEAYASGIDIKLDDGLPQSGNIVQADAPAAAYGTDVENLVILCKKF